MHTVLLLHGSMTGVLGTGTGRLAPRIASSVRYMYRAILHQHLCKGGGAGGQAGESDRQGIVLCALTATTLGR
jgi:hypothetical protein